MSYMEFVVSDPNIIPLCQKAFETNTTDIQFKVLTLNIVKQSLMILGKVILRKWNTFAQCDFENMLNYFFSTISFFN